jgi:hypothetical protein
MVRRSLGAATARRPERRAVHHFRGSTNVDLARALGGASVAEREIGVSEMKTVEARLVLVLGMAIGFLGCAAPQLQEERASTTARLLKPHAAADLPASDADAFAEASGSAHLDIKGWEGYVAGTSEDALFLTHLSGMNGSDGIGGLSIAFVEGAGTRAAKLEQRLLEAASVEVRFNNGSGLVSRHTFGPPATTAAAHHGDPDSEALLQRAFNDAEALLRLPVDDADGGEDAQTCAASFLATVSSAARCVDNPANTADCAVVRQQAVLIAAYCAGAPTANVLVGRKTTLRPKLFGGSSIFANLFPIGGGSFGTSIGGGGGLDFGGLLGNLLLGNGGTRQRGFVPVDPRFDPTFDPAFDPRFDPALDPRFDRRFVGGFDDRRAFRDDNRFLIDEFGNERLCVDELNGGRITRCDSFVRRF